MKVRLYSIYDKGAQEFGPLFNAKNDHVASRYFFQTTSQSDCKSEFELYAITEMDTESGQLDFAFDKHLVNVEEHKI